VIANQVTARRIMPPLVRLVDLAMGSLGCFQCITVNSIDLLREYSRYPATYRGAPAARPPWFRAQIDRPFQTGGAPGV
jgi:hypothetical protein